VNNRVVGIATNDMGIAKDGSKKSNYQRGMELKGVISSSKYYWWERPVLKLQISFHRVEFGVVVFIWGALQFPDFSIVFFQLQAASLFLEKVAEVLSLRYVATSISLIPQMLCFVILCTCDIF